MKKIAILSLLIVATLGSYAQKVKLDSTGNYIAVKEPRNLDSTGTATGKTYTDTKGHIYPVYKNSTGKLFVIRMSKAGNVYKQYLKL